MSKKNDKASAIAACKDRQGRIDPADVVEAARNPASPLHSEFEWNDSEAAKLHRLETARRLIREVRYIQVFEERRIVTPAYVHDPRTLSDYIETTRIARNGTAAKRVLEDELSRIESAIGRAIAISEAFALKSAFEKMLLELTVIRQLVNENATSDGERLGVHS